MTTLFITEPNNAQRKVERPPGKYTIGRGPKNDIVLDDPNTSESHAQIRLDIAPGQHAVKDTGSTNGVFVNDKKVIGVVEFANGDTLTMGQTSIVVGDKGVDLEKTRIMDFSVGSKTDRIGIGTPLQDLQTGRHATIRLNINEIEAISSDSSIDQDGTLFLSPEHIVEPEKPSAHHKLITVSGENFGKEFLLDKQTITIGKNPESDIALSDNALSRFHAKILVSSDSCRIQDLKSTNGTFVNKKRLAGTMLLRHGDRIRVGKTVLKFVDYRMADRSEFPVFKMVALSMVALIAVIIVAALIFQDSRKTEAVLVAPETQSGIIPLDHDKAQEAQVQAESRLKTKTAELYYNTTLEFIDFRLWEKALEKARQLSEIDPDYPGLLQARRKAVFEKENYEQYQKGIDLIVSQDFDLGISLLSKIPQDSVYYDEARVEIAVVQKNLEEKAGAEQKAKELQRVIAEKRKLEEALVKMQKTTSVQTQEKITTTPAQPVASARMVAPGDSYQDLEKARELYMAGNIDQAMETLSLAASQLPHSSLERERITRTADSIRIAFSLYERGLREYRSGNIEGAFSTWFRLIEVDKEIAGATESFYTRQVGTHMSEQLCKNAWAAYQAQNHIQAVDMVNRAVIANPDSTQCLEIRGLIDERARALFQEGYALEGIDPQMAISKWKQLVSTFPESSEYHERALQQLVRHSR